IILLGVTFFVGMVAAGKRGSGLAIPGAVITMLGILLFIQNTFILWVTWAYAWALLISAAGLGLLIMNLYIKRVNLRRVAGLLIGIGLILFVIFGVLFELILDISGTNMNSGLFLGGGLVLLGIFVILSRPLFSKGRKPAEVEGIRSEGPAPVDADFEEVEEGTQVPQDVMQQPLPEDAEFSSLDFKSAGEVIIVQGDSCELTIDGSSEILKDITAEIHDGILQILLRSGVEKWTGLKQADKFRDIRYHVKVKTLQQITLDGTGNIHADKLEGEKLVLNHSSVGEMVISDLNYSELRVDLSGVGKVQLDGDVHSQSVNLDGSGSYQAENLKSEIASISLGGVGSACVWVEGELKVDISGAGKVEFKGNPNIEEEITGLGSITPLNPTV
ncbi:MAG: head GIN domain-containing protein, partial [Chloroflexota bacterium]|nr:head GIN domain-containing protein [Chloroflexota bacterium]